MNIILKGPIAILRLPFFLLAGLVGGLIAWYRWTVDDESWN